MKEKTLTKQICSRSLSGVFLLSLFLVIGYSSDTIDEQTLTDNHPKKTVQEISKSGDIQSFLSEESRLSHFCQTMNNIHSLKTLTRFNINQISLFLMDDNVSEKWGIAEKEKLLDNESVGEGSRKSNANLSKINNRARILQQIQLEDGHLLYKLENLIA